MTKKIFFLLSIPLVLNGFRADPVRPQKTEKFITEGVIQHLDELLIFANPTKIKSVEGFLKIKIAKGYSEETVFLANIYCKKAWWVGLFLESMQNQEVFLNLTPNGSALLYTHKGKTINAMINDYCAPAEIEK